MGAELSALRLEAPPSPLQRPPTGPRQVFVALAVAAVLVIAV